METKDRKLAWFLLVLLSIVWGASYILISLSLYSADKKVRLLPDELGAIRMIVASLVLLPFFIKFRKNIKKEHLGFIFIAGLCGNGLPAYLFAYAQTHLASAITGMLNSFVPIFSILIATVVFGFKVRWNHLLGIALGVSGVFLIVYSELKDVSFTIDLIIPFVLVMCATLCYAISLNVIKYKLNDLRPMTITSTAFLFVGLPSLVYLFFSDFPRRVVSDPTIVEGVWFVLILAIVGTAVAVYLFNHLIKISSPVFASSVTYFIPVVATLLGILAGEEITVFMVLGMLVLISGVFLINKKVKDLPKDNG